MAKRLLHHTEQAFVHAKSLRHQLTDAERLLWQHLRAGRLQGYKFRRQQAIGKYVVDFVCIEAKLIVEADGGQHLQQQAYDKNRSDYFHQQGFAVLRFWNHDILQQTTEVLENILSYLENMSPPSPQPLPLNGEGLK